MSDTLRLSVIVPLCGENAAQQAALWRNLLPDDTELILADACDAALEYTDERVRVLSAPGAGLGQAWKAGAEAATGDYVFLATECLSAEPTLFEETLSCAEKTGADMVVFDVCRKNTSNGEEELRCGVSPGQLPGGADVFSLGELPDACRMLQPLRGNKLIARSLLTGDALTLLNVGEGEALFDLYAALHAEKLAWLNRTLLTADAEQPGDGDLLSDAHLDALRSLINEAETLPAYPAIRNSLRCFVTEYLFALLRRSGEIYSVSYLRRREKIEKFFTELPLFAELREEDFDDHRLFNRVCLFLRHEEQRRAVAAAEPLDRELIVSMTSYPARIEQLHVALNSVFDQSRRADRVILYLAKGQFPAGEAELPPQLLAYKELGLEIFWCDGDLRPHKKYFYAMQQFPEALIVTVDDDLRYTFDMVEVLAGSYRQHPEAVSATRVHLINLTEDGHIAPYSDWSMEYSQLVGVPAFRLFSTSGAGTLYPPHCLDEGAFDEAKIRSCCLNADDIWLKIHQMRAGTPVVLARPNLPLQYVSDTQEDALQTTNVTGNGNDVQIRRTLEAFNMSEAELTVRFEMGLEPQETQAQRWKKSVRARDERIERMKKEIEDIRKSPSYRIGRAVTLLPRAAVKGVKSLREKGLAATVSRLLVKLHLMKES